MEVQESVLNERKPSDHPRMDVMQVMAILFVVGFVISLPSLQGSDAQMDVLENLSRFFGRMWPPDFSVLAQTMSALWETIQMALMATCLSILISIPLSACASRSVMPWWIVASTRMILNCIRTIPGLIWAVIAVSAVGANSLAGVIALTFYSIGYLGKFFSDAFDSVSPDVAEGLKAIGADPVQSFQYGLWPHAKPLIGSHSLWMLEYNIRSASIIGYVGAGGIGLQLHSYHEYYQWDKFATVLLVILLVVTLLDLCGEWMRGQITKKIRKPLAS